MKITKYLLDTNYILRFLLADIPFQFQKAKELFKKIEDNKAIGLVSILVINELIWILEHFYKQNRKDYLQQILKLISLKNIKIIEIKKMDLIFILEKMNSFNLDFTDLYLLFWKEKLNHQLASFDKKIL